MKAVGIIPVRLESSRLPEKAIADICGLPMFVHTCKRAMLSNSLDDVFLATDNQNIKNIAEQYDIKTIMTKTSHKNSSERIAEACQVIDCDVIVNIQGDEPLLNPTHIDQILEPFYLDDDIQVSIGITSFSKQNSISDIKAVTDLNGDLLYCSRNDIPFNNNGYLKLSKLVFIVPHRKKCIIKYLEWEPSPLEILEDNHFLRLIENGVKIRAVEVEEGFISVDTIEDLEEVRKAFKKDKIKEMYTK